MKLITELYDDVEVVTESTDSGKKYVIKGIVAQAEKLNRNQRVYPKGILEREINKHILEKVNTNQAGGQLNHPNYFKIEPKEVSHRFTLLEFRGNDVYGEANILNTPNGKILKAFVDDGYKFGMSTRGIGTIKKNSKGLNEVNEDFNLSCIDAVTDPSGIDCWVDGVLENKYFEIVDGIITEQVLENYKTIIKKTPSKQLEQTTLKLFEDFFKSLNTK